MPKDMRIKHIQRIFQLNSIKSMLYEMKYGAWKAWKRRAYREK
jgi:hypothetical protein